MEWNWRMEDDGEERRFHVDHFLSTRQGWGHGSRALGKIIEWAAVEHEADVFSIQMGGGAPTARWLDTAEFHLRVKDVQGYEGESWKDPDAERVDGREDTEGDEMSSVYAEIPDLKYEAMEQDWMTKEELGWD